MNDNVENLLCRLEQKFGDTTVVMKQIREDSFDDCDKCTGAMFGDDECERCKGGMFG